MALHRDENTRLQAAYTVRMAQASGSTVHQKDGPRQSNGRRRLANKISSNAQNPLQNLRISPNFNTSEVTEKILLLDEIIGRNDGEVDQRPTWPMTCAEPPTMRKLDEKTIHTVEMSWRRKIAEISRPQKIRK